MTPETRAVMEASKEEDQTPETSSMKRRLKR